MALKTFKPYTKSTRGTILVDRTGLWKGKPFKSLVSPKNSMKGRNNNGHITSINRAGGHKKMYRHIDFYRRKFDAPATVERIEYDPNRSCYIMLVKFEDNSHAYYLAPQKIKVGDKVENGSKKDANFQDISSKVDIIEPAGSDTFVVTKLGNKEVTARFHSETDVKIGSKVKFSFNLQKVTYFDPKTGQRIK